MILVELVEDDGSVGVMEWRTFGRVFVRCGTLGWGATLYGLGSVERSRVDLGKRSCGEGVRLSGDGEANSGAMSRWPMVAPMDRARTRGFRAYGFTGEQTIWGRKEISSGPGLNAWVWGFIIDIIFVFKFIYILIDKLIKPINSTYEVRLGRFCVAIVMTRASQWNWFGRNWKLPKFRLKPGIVRL